jgi:hypothetical protein
MSANRRHQCPECGYEYEPWVEICPDCGVLVEDVVDAEGQRKGALLGRDEDPHWKVVTNVPNAIIGSLLKSQLEDAGIPVLMRRSASADIAQFSGNDFVPQDLLVPENKMSEARSLLDSGSDISPGPPYWGGGYESGEDDEWEDEAEVDSKEKALEQLRRLWNADSHPESSAERSLPDGWMMLPTERDVRARTQHQRTHGEEGWKWQDHGQAPGQEASSFEGPYPVDRSQWQAKTGYEYAKSSPAPKLQRIDASDYEVENWGTGGTPRWVRLFYGILLTALSLPFIFQLLQQLSSIFK